MRRTYHCKDCVLNGGTSHTVYTRDQARHRAAIAEFLAAEPASAPAVETPVATAETIDDVDSLGNFFAALVVTDDGPSVRTQQHSRLFSSRHDFQESVPDVPVAFESPSREETMESIHAVADAPRVRLPQPTRKQRRENALTEMRDRIRLAQNSLDIISTMYADNKDVPSARMMLDAAAETVAAAGRLLRSIKAAKNSKRLASLWQQTFDDAVVLDKLVDSVGAIVPQDDVDNPDDSPIDYNTDHHYENPIQNHNTLSQIVILFSIVTNVIMGLSTGDCNFILDSVLLMVRLTMSTSLPPVEQLLSGEESLDEETSDEESRAAPQPAQYTAAQRDILKELPKTLESALKTFKLEPKTQIFAVCPSCHYTHDPRANRLTGEAIYPTECRNLVFRDKHSPAVPCATPLLEDRQGKLRPIKPFVMPDFTDHLASVLSDPEIVQTCNNACDKAWDAVRDAMATDPPALRAMPTFLPG
uniref:Uncharacterized protein n=1 Tax=Mycena chlorophos TaxID=658473 RepID=A0ABQ0LDL6_MYCCL|nr:predicted protein [Mycena chlorophos]